MIENMKGLIDENFSYYRLTDEDKEKIVEELLIFCKENNIDTNNLEFISAGESSICYQADGLIVKVCFIDYHVSLTEYVKHSNVILKPLVEKVVNVSKFHNPHLLITKKLDTTNITDRDVFNVYCDLRNAGYLWRDTRACNLGRDESGDVLLFDYGELISIREMTNQERAREIRTHETIKPDYAEAYRIGSFEPLEKDKKTSWWGAFIKRK